MPKTYVERMRELRGDRDPAEGRGLAWVIFSPKP